jgi:uncharacterized membrane protein YkoI
MRYFIFLVSVFCVSGFAGVDSSINVPYDKHQKYTLGNQKNHSTIRLEGERYFASLAKISKAEIKEKLFKEGFVASSISLEDRASELVYVVYAKDAKGKQYRLFVDAGNGVVLDKEGV